MNDTDLLQIKIEKAKAQLSPDTVNAISAVPWQAEILKMRETKGYSFEQLGDLETETELLLCGLLSPENYPKELKSRMRISETQANDLVKEMNEQVFSKIKEELIKISERKNIIQETEKTDAQVLREHGIEIIQPDLTIPELNSPLRSDLGQTTPEVGNKIHPIMADKLSGPVQTPAVKTEHSVENLTKTDAVKTYPKGSDPYRLPPV